MIAEILGMDGIVVVVVVALVLLLGGSRIPKLARGLGTAQHEFKKGLEEGGSEVAQADGGAQPPQAKKEPTDVGARAEEGHGRTGSG